MILQWIVTAATAPDEVGPAVMVEVDAPTPHEGASLAAYAGLALLRVEDAGSPRWGIECEHCEQVAITKLLVVDLSGGAKHYFDIRPSIVPGGAP